MNYGAVWPVVDRIFGTYREEPIIYIDGIEPELPPKSGDAGEKGATAASVKDAEELISGDTVAETAEDAVEISKTHTHTKTSIFVIKIHGFF